MLLDKKKCKIVRCHLMAITCAETYPESAKGRETVLVNSEQREVESGGVEFGLGPENKSWQLDAKNFC